MAFGEATLDAGTRAPTIVLPVWGIPLRKRKPDAPVIEVTEGAAEQIRALLAEDEKVETHGLRMKVVGGGCSGLQYQLSFDDEIREIDHQVERHGVKVIIDEKSALYLVGCKLDYVDTLQETGFKIDNPNATNSCGCGQSFAA